VERLTIGAFVVGMLAAKGLAILAVVYVGARLAIRHERESSVKLAPLLVTEETRTKSSNSFKQQLLFWATLAIVGTAIWYLSTNWN
jgi:hypothetical protein